MTLLQLEYALALQRLGNYGRASKSVGISQPGLSIQIKNLEEELGITLFDRSQKQVTATAAGEVFLERAQLLLTQSRQLKELANALSEEYEGKIDVGIIPTLAPYLLPLFISQLNEQYPKLKVHVKEAITEEIVQGIKTGELDFGIIATPIESKIMLSVLPLFYESFMLFISPEHQLYPKEKIEIEEIPISDIYLLKEGNCLRNQVDDICEVQDRAEHENNLFYFESTSIESLCRIVEYKGGITLLPELTTLQFDGDRENMIKELGGPRRVREISIIHLPNHVRSSFIKEIADLIQKSVPRKLLAKGDSNLIHTNVKV